jgi:predicted outer membrane repeat protein
MLPGSHVIVSSVMISGGHPFDAQGGGILVDGDNGDLGPAQVLLTECRVTHNQGTSGGGGIASSGILTITKCTIDSNTTQGDSSSSGGGIYINTDSTLHMGNSTVNKNKAQDQGGGINIANDAKPPSVLNNVTLVNNTLVETDSTLAQGAGIAIGNGVLTVTNSILAGNKIGDGTANECHGNIRVMRYTLLQTPTPDCRTIDTDTTGLITSTAPNLGPFALHGGATPTYSLLEGSPAINAGNPATKNPALDPESCFATDQRGRTRADRCDMGAFELIQEQQTLSDTLFLPALGKH